MWYYNHGKEIRNNLKRGINMKVDIHNCFSLYVPPGINDQTGREWFYNISSAAFTAAYIRSKEFKHVEVRFREHGKIVRKWVIDYEEV